MAAFWMLATCSVADEPAEKAVEIPISSVWALHMEGTRDIRELESPVEESRVSKLLEELSRTWQGEEGIAVQGEGREALDEVCLTFTKKLPRNQVHSDQPVSLVFYTAAVGYYIHLQDIKRVGNKFTIRYRFEPHQTRDLRLYMALIPVGRLPTGKYAVKIENLPLDKEWIDRGYEKPLARQLNHVCHSFEFKVLERR